MNLVILSNKSYIQKPVGTVSSAGKHLTASDKCAHHVVVYLESFAVEADAFDADATDPQPFVPINLEPALESLQLGDTAFTIEEAPLAPQAAEPAPERALRLAMQGIMSGPYYAGMGTVDELRRHSALAGQTEESVVMVTSHCQISILKYVELYAASGRITFIKQIEFA